MALARLLWVAALLCLLIGRGASAAPAVSGVTGAVTSGSSITISGSGFGTKAHAGPMLWGDFDSYGNSGVVAGTSTSTAPLIRQGNLASYATWSLGTAGVTGGAQILFDNATPKPGSTYHARATFQATGAYWGLFLGVPYTQWTTGQKLYISYYLRSTIPGGYPRQQKALIGYTSEWSDRIYYSWDYISPCGSGNYARLHISTIPYESSLTGTSTAFNGQWIRLDNYLVQSGQSVANGRWDGTMYRPAVPTRSSSSLVNQVMRTTADEVTMFALGGAYYDVCPESAGSGIVDIDDVYIDSTPQRVEMCDTATWAARNKCEIQLPTAWTDTAITATVKPGSFSSGTAYLYVTDGTNAANANGYAVTVGGAADTTAPTAPTLLKTDSPSTSSISLKWTAGTDDVGPVTTEIDRCTGYGCTSYSTITTTAAATYTDTGLTSAQIYRYRLRSRDGAGNVSAYLEAHFNPRPTIPAFPGAEGGGAESVGGRGGIVYEVTNLNASGPGSLRAGVEMTGPRTIVFRVAGIINCNISGGQKGLEIRNPYLTIAGQTAPGGGITISGKNSVQGNCITNYTHDVILRYIRIRHGYTGYSEGDNIASSTAASSSIYDHVSLSWGTDENASSWGAPQNNLTYSWLMMYEPLMLVNENNFSKGFLTGSGNNASENMTNIDIHHSFMANTTHRNPLIKNKSFRLVNNIIYNWKFSATALIGGVNLDVIGNYYKAGPLRQGRIPYEIYVCPTPGPDTPLGPPSIFSSGNIGYHNPTPANDDWGMIWEVTSESIVDEWETPAKLIGVLPAQYRRATPLPTLPYPITAQSAAELDNRVLPTVGASHRLDCMGNWVENRDTVDRRVISEYHNLQGNYYVNEDSVGGFPVIDPGTACTDTDGDGMPDAWETAQGLNPSSAADGPQLYASGYSNLERYLAGPQTKPVLSGLLPASRHPSGTAATSLQVTTSLVSNCRYGTSSAATFAAMTPFATTGGTSHSSAVTVRAGGVYRYFAKCQGSAGDISDAGEIRFSVDPVRQRERRWRR
ncbi:MAG TPA: hypothetical protein DCQ84_13990 [Candidatus Competibacteraceae bacterium]|nr:hypothetical protein [Candidatus Competibacteraceae bacterium]